MELMAAIKGRRSIRRFKPEPVPRELLAKLLGELDDRPVVNLALSVDWQAARAALVAALAPWPDARVAVASALVAIEGGIDRGKRSA